MDDTVTRTRTEQRTLINLFSDLWRGTSKLVHDEIALARVELAEKASQIESGFAALGVAAAVLFAGFLLLLIAASNALALALPPHTAPWLAPLIVGAGVLLIGAIALATGRARLRARNLTPRRTLESLRRDRELVKEHVHDR